MLKLPFLSKNWLCSCEDFEKSDTVLIGIPFDNTCSLRPGSRFAPQAIRTCSIGIESYSPYLKNDLEDISFYDAGDLDLPFGNTQKVMDIIQNAAKEVLSCKKRLVVAGGEHLITFPIIKEYVKVYPDIAVIQFDAHADLREEYLGEKLSHACVMRRISEIVGLENIIQVGIRSGTKEEFNIMKENNTLVKNLSDFKILLNKLGNRPVFLTIDLDVLDPSLMKGTGTPEPGGFSFDELISYIKELQDVNIVGADVVELSPDYDNSGVSTVTAAKVIREVLLLNRND